LPLAARCAASPEVKIEDDFKREIQDALIARTQDMQTDLRARISAGEALGVLGDPRFILQHGEHGEYLLPPMVKIAGDTYPIGDDNSGYDFERPAHPVELAPFEIGKFPVTNAEYAKFMAAEGYENEQWWDTPEALQWLREGGAEGQKQSWRDDRKTILSWSENHISNLLQQDWITPKQADDWIIIRNWSEDEFEQWLAGEFDTEEVYRQPRFWNDTSFNNPAQPVVGVTWFEARAYCNWLAANTGQTFRLPTQVEFEAAARGKKGRVYPYDNQFDPARSNTFESHIRRTTPVGIFDNATPEGAFDLSGNAYTWTLSIYDQQQFPYLYHNDDEREDIRATGVRRVLRGGSWYLLNVHARAAYRSLDVPAARGSLNGFRVCRVGRPPSVLL
jgi:formylglycine-generating enzyme required for sulfatase activity